MHGTSEKHKPVHSDLLVPRNAYVFYQLFLRTDSHQSRKKPTVAAVTLMHIRSRRAVDEELRFVEDVLNPFNPRRCVDILHSAGKASGHALQTVWVTLRIEDGVAILLVQPLALFHDRGDFGSTLGCRLLPRLRRVLFHFQPFACRVRSHFGLRFCYFARRSRDSLCSFRLHREEAVP